MLLLASCSSLLSPDSQEPGSPSRSPGGCLDHTSQFIATRSQLSPELTPSKARSKTQGQPLQQSMPEGPAPYLDSIQTARPVALRATTATAGGGPHCSSQTCARSPLLPLAAHASHWPPVQPPRPVSSSLAWLLSGGTRPPASSPPCGPGEVLSPPPASARGITTWIHAEVNGSAPSSKRAAGSGPEGSRKR